jgi:endonuclease YncB( thermonuclease family)
MCTIALAVLAVGGYTRAALAPGYPPQDFSVDIAHAVTRVVAGDVVEVEYAGSRQLVRLAGLALKRQPGSPSSVVDIKAKAARLAGDLLRGEHVYLRPTGGVEDASGHVTAYVFRAPDGLFVNLELVRQGYAAADPRTSHAHGALFRDYALRAREAGKGMWAQPAPAPPPLRTVATPRAGSRDQLRDPSGVTVYITKTGKKYHSSGCRSLARSKIPTPLVRARLTLEPCKVCKPPK